MFQLTVPWWEILARAALLYVVLFALVRMTGKRQVGEMTPFDLILLMLLSEQASQALSGGDQSVTGATMGLVILVMLNVAVVFITARWMRAEHWLEGRPQFLIRDGRVDYKMLKRESISKNDLMASLREHGCMSPHEA